VGDVMDDAGLGAVEADKAHAAEDRLSREQFRQYSLVGQAVLECQQGGMLADQRRQQFAEAMVRRGLQGDDDKIARADFPRRLGGDWAATGRTWKSAFRLWICTPFSRTTS